MASRNPSSKRRGGDVLGAAISSVALMQLSQALGNRFDNLGYLVDLRNAMRCLWLAIDLTDIDEAKSSMFAILGQFYTRMFKRLGKLEDLNKAIACQNRAVLLAGDNKSKRPILHDLEASYMLRFERNGDRADVDKAFECQMQAIQVTEDGHSDDKPARLGSLGTSYLHRFERYSDVADIDRAIKCYKEAVRLIPDGHADMAGHLNNLGNSYMTRFENYGYMADIDKSIEYHLQALRVTPNGHEDRLVLLNNIGNSYLRRFERNGDSADVGEAIACHEQAVKLTPDGHPNKLGRLNNLGSSYTCRYEHFGDVADVDEAIKLLVQAVQLTPAGYAGKPTLLNNLGNVYKHRFERHGDVADIDKSIECLVESVELTPNGHADKPARFTNLGSSYMRRFERQGEDSDVEMSIKSHLEAVQLLPDSHPDKADFLCNLGNPYMSRFERYGDVTDVDEGIKYYLQALHLSSHNYGGKPRLLNNLGSSYMRRFERHRDVADLDKSIKFEILSVQLTPDSHVEKPGRLSNLGSSYMRRFKLDKNVSDIDRAVECYLQAEELTSDGHAEKPGLLSNLGSAYHDRFDWHGDAADAEKSIKCFLQAVQFTPDGHAIKPGLLNNLGTSYTRRFEIHGNVADLDKAIQLHERAVQLTPEGHAFKPTFLDNLGNSYLRRFTKHAQSQDLQAAVLSFKLAAQSEFGDPLVRFTASCQWARHSPLLGISPQLGYHRTMEVVSQLVWLGIPIKQRYDIVLKIGDISMEAASWAIALNLYDCALEWLEQGRSVVWNQILQLRTPFDDLHAVDPELAKHLKKVAQDLECASSRIATPVSANDEADLEKDAQRHRRLAAEWNQLLEQTRLLPGFEDFMRPRKAAQLIRAAKDGPLIVINVYKHRCDALIIQPNSDTMAHVPLNNFSQSRAEDVQKQLVSLIGHRGGRTGGFQTKKRVAKEQHHPFKAILTTLWSEVVKPIFDCLGYAHRSSNEELPHVTWCTTGQLSFFPLHAAGHHDGAQPNALDLVVSSYTPTLSALLASSRPDPNSSSGILLVGQQYTTGHCDLPGTIQELAAIKEHATRVGYLQLDGDNAAVDAVLNGMEEYSWVHLACHATQDKEDPAQSAFHLRDGDLMLSTITQKSFKNKGLAFLSACQTATGDERLPDEAVHLAAGMLMAGYPSVIATMWSIQDEDAPEVAHQVYADLLMNGRMDCTKAARALHKAVIGLREKFGQGSFERWLPFTHIGV